MEFYQEKYQLTETTCCGPNFIPTSFDELFEVMDMKDDWDLQIACVLTGFKKVAMTDYDKLNNPEDLEYYYRISPKDNELRRFALEHGVQHLEDKYGTEFWFYPEYLPNANILINHYNKIEKFPDGYYTSIQALLLGYTEISIILYELHQDIVSYRISPDNYPLLLSEYINKQTPIIDYAKAWITQRGGII